MAKNHEVRFKCEKELSDKSITIWKDIAQDLKRSAFYRKVFILGLKGVQEQVLKEREAIKNLA